MKIVTKFTKNQKGMSLVTVLGSIAVGLGLITYVIKDALPKLQSEKKRIDSQLSYRILISSINDYIVHGIRERWCINWENGGETDLLESTNCSSKASMEDIVTYPGNLERVLWGADTIGTKLSSPPDPESANRILALNYVRHKAGKTTKVLDYEDVAPTDGKLKFRISQNTLKNMNESHPLYVMSRKVMDCINKIDIEVFQVKDFSNQAIGDERKVGIKISTDITKSKVSCLAVQTAESMSYYTFYPRRLHTFSLLKYGDLDGSLSNEFHGPVYVAGNFILPPKNSNKESTTVFYNTLTLGVYNGGSNKKRYQGKILDNTGKDFTYVERGHPYLGKQDHYEGFRGFLGGLKLDSSEDKGFYNLFDHTSVSSVDISQLEACIEDNQSILNKAKNVSSQLLYKLTNKDPTYLRTEFSFDHKNRYSSNEDRPRVVLTAGSKLNENLYNIDVKDFKDVEALGEIRFQVQDKSYLNKNTEDYRATIGDNSTVTFEPNFEKFKVTLPELNAYLKKLETVTYSNYFNSIDSQVIKKTQVYDQFDKAMKSLVAKCENALAPDCVSIGYKVPGCNAPETPKPIPNPTPGKPGLEPPINSPIKENPNQGIFTEEEEEEEEVEDDDNTPIKKPCGKEMYKLESSKYQTTYSALINYINQLKDFQQNKDTSLEVTLRQVAKHKNKTVLNQRALEFKFPHGWQEYFNLFYGELQSFNISFVPFHYGVSGSLSFQTSLMGSQYGNNPRIIKNKNGSQSMEDLKHSWTKTTTNDPISPDPLPIIELDCPQGMGVADWDLDMSKSSNFSWNYANTPPGAVVDANDHQQAPPIIFHPGNPPLEGHAYSSTKSVVEECIIPADRTHVYGFYVCNKITIKPRTSPLYMVGTFITKDLDIPKSLRSPIHWLSIWDTKATDLIMTDLSSEKPGCTSISNLTSKTWKDVVVSPAIGATVDSCGPLDLVTNGPNNFSWTTVDPDVGIANPGDVMTSQKVNRIQKWIIREESRSDLVR